MSLDRDDDSPLDLSPWAAPPPPRGLGNRVMDAVRASGEPADGRPSTRPAASLRANGNGQRPRWRGIAIGAALAAAAAAIVWVALPRPRTSGPTSGHVVTGAPSKITLAGGTVALLGAGADVTWERTRAGLAVTQAAGNVTYQHAGPSSLVITTPLAEVHTAGASLNVEVPMSSKKIALAGVAGAGVAAAIVIAVYEGKAEVRQPSTAAQVVEGGGQVAVAAPAPSRNTFTPVAKAVKDRAQRDAIAAAIAQARAARAAGAGGGSAALPAGSGAGSGTVPTAKVDLTPGQLSKEEIRDGVRETIPLLTECYTLMIEKHPRMGGKVVAKLVVDAEPDIGTIVTMQDDSEVNMRGAAEGFDPRELQNDLGDFRQCLTATLETVALPPLGDKDGGRVEITYPFIFAPSEEEADQYNDDAPKPPGPTQKPATPSNDISIKDPFAEPPAGMTAEELLQRAEAAAKQSQWARALYNAEQALKVGSTAQTNSRAALVASLAACNINDARKARAYFPRATGAAKNLIRQRCLAAGIEVDDPAPKPADKGSDVMDPFK